ncbi:hypothetical protein AWU68_1246 [Corynebacterium simulans]|nr:hypothetical protein AWU68_1246 [Corynebacterium simulans]
MPGSETFTSIPMTSLRAISIGFTLSGNADKTRVEHAGVSL